MLAAILIAIVFFCIAAPAVLTIIQPIGREERLSRRQRRIIHHYRAG